MRAETVSAVLRRVPHGVRRRTRPTTRCSASRACCPRTQKRHGFRSSYVGSEVFLSLVDPKEAPYPRDLRQLAVTALCTNRDLPLLMPLGHGQTRLHAGDCRAGPGDPLREGTLAPATRRSGEGDAAWQLHQPPVAQLPVARSTPTTRKGAAALRAVLELYARRRPTPRCEADRGRSRGPRRARRCAGSRRPGRSPSAAAWRSSSRSTSSRSRAAARSCSARAGAVLRAPRVDQLVHRDRAALGARGEVMRWVPRWGERTIA